MLSTRASRIFSEIILGVAILALLAAPARAQRAMALVDVLNVPRISDPHLSPDGRQILYVLSAADWKANKRISHIWRVQSDGANPLQMTNGANGETSPRWSPDGKSIAFVAKRGAARSGSGGSEQGTESRGEDANPSQVFLMPADGGEGRALTKHATSVSHIAWSPDGSAIYFTAPDEKTTEEKAREKAKDDVYAFDEDYRQPHIWKVAAAERKAEGRVEEKSDGKEERITSGDYAITSFEISRDGKRVVVERAPNPLLGSSGQSEIWVMNIDGSGARQLTHNQVPESGAEISPDGAQVIFLAQANERFEPYYNRKIFLEPSSGGSSRVLTPDLPYEVERATWSKDGRSLFFLANMGVHAELFQLDLAGGKPKQLTDGQHNVTNWTYSEASDRHVFTIDEPSNPGDVYSFGGGSTAPARVTHVFDHLARDFKLPRQEKLEWKGADGTTVEGILFYPIDYRQGQKYPLAVQTHGGPQASDKFGFGSWGDYVQVLTAKGYAVLHPNYRGSTGTGDAFLRDMVGHYFNQAHLDVLAGVDKVIAMGVADPEKLVKMGWSGGGHMTDKLITFTDRFKAASAGAGAANWVSMYAQSDVRVYRTPWFGGTPWQQNAPIDVYWNNSPLKDVANVKTPTIFLVGEKDVRVPMPQSVEMYRALKSNGVPTHLYVAPREPHGWQELRHELFKMNVELGWFEKYAMKRDYTWEKAPQEKDTDGVQTSAQQ